LKALPDDFARAQFEEDVLRKCRRHYPMQSDGKVLYPFHRIFFVAYR
jgi:trans-aconitate methyltransferase